MSDANLHQTEVRGRSLYGKGLDCVSAYAAIGATVHYTRRAKGPQQPHGG